MYQCSASFFLRRLLLVVRVAVFAFAVPPAFFLVEDFLLVFELASRFFVPAVLLFRAFPSCLYRPVPDYNKREHGHRYMQFPARISCGRRDPPAFRVCDCSGRGLIS